MGGEVGGGEKDTLDMNEDETGSEVKSSKKQELKQKRAILTQFDKIATNY